jgi:hypothetical protein
MDRTKPAFYVSVVDGEQFGLLAGPFATHDEALALVDKAQALAEELNRRAVFYSFGTVQMKTGERDGLLNSRLGVTSLR